MMTSQKILFGPWMLKITILVTCVIAIFYFAIHYTEYFNNSIEVPHLLPKVYSHPSEARKVFIPTEKLKSFSTSPNYVHEHISDLSKITSKSAFFIFQKKMKAMAGEYYEVKTLLTGPVSYDKSDNFPKQIDGVPTWEYTTYKEFNHWLPKSKYYVGFGTWIGVTLFYGTQLVKKAVGFEGDPSAFAEVYSNMEGNSHRVWYNHTYVYPVAVRTGEDKQGAKRVSMRSDKAGNSCSGMKEISRKDNACGSDGNRVSWDIDGYTLPHLLELNRIPVSSETFIKIDVESYECELIPSWLPWLKKFPSKPTMFISFHGKGVRCCSIEQYNKILEVSKLYKGVWSYMKKKNPEEFFKHDNCTTEVLTFSDL